jgi:hypothetical protein
MRMTSFFQPVTFLLRKTYLYDATKILSRVEMKKTKEHVQCRYIPPSMANHQMLRNSKIPTTQKVIETTENRKKKNNYPKLIKSLYRYTRSVILRTGLSIPIITTVSLWATFIDRFLELSGAHVCSPV